MNGLCAWTPLKSQQLFHSQKTRLGMPTALEESPKKVQCFYDFSLKKNIQKIIVFNL